MKTIKEIRTEQGLSQQKFGDKYNIPLRTIQSWESGDRSAPDYVLELMNYRTAAEQLNTMGYVLNVYSDSFGSGYQETFKTEAEAVKRGKAEWDKLDERDKNRYRDDPAAEFLVALVPMIWDEDEDEFYPDMSGYNAIWSAL